MRAFLGNCICVWFSTSLVLQPPAMNSAVNGGASTLALSPKTHTGMLSGSIDFFTVSIE